MLLAPRRSRRGTGWPWSPAPRRQRNARPLRRVPDIFIKAASPRVGWNLPVVLFLRFQSTDGTSRACRSADRSRRYGRTGGPLQLQRLHDERELVGARLGEVLEHEVLEQMDTVDGKRDVVDRQIDRLVRIGGDFHRPVVRTKQHRVLLDQPLGRSHADSRTAARVELVVDAPVLAPSGVNEHGITRLQACPLLLQRLLQVGCGNLVVDWQNSTPLRPAMSISTPRVIKVPTFSIPIL